MRPDYNYDYRLIESVMGRYEFSEIPYFESNGRIVVTHKGVSFDCFFNRKTDSKKLYVFFSGGRDQNIVKFYRWSWYAFIDGSMLNIDDPMYLQFENLRTAYYFGTKDLDYRSLICDIVRDFVKKYEYEEVIFYGSSAGGSAAIHCACLMEGTQAIAINPQIKLSIDYHANDFENVTGMKLSNDPLMRDDVLDLVEDSKSSFVFVENMASMRDELQRKYLMEFYDTFHNEIGIVKLSDNCVLWSYDIDMGSESANHQACDSDTVFWAISELSNKLLKRKMDDSMYDDFKTISMLWRDSAVLQRQLNKYKKMVDFSSIEYVLKAFSDSASKVFIFGAGIWGTALIRYCEKIGIGIEGFVVTDDFVDYARKRTDSKVVGLLDLDETDKIIIATAKVESIKAVIESGLQYHVLPEWFMRDISGT